MAVDLRCLAWSAPWAIAAVSQPADAAVQTLPAHEVRIGRCIREASDGRAWLEKTLWGLRDQEAGWVGAEVPNSNGTHDLGPLQVNSSWVAKLSVLVGRDPRVVRKWLINDPCFNIEVAKWLFLSGMRTSGSYWQAIGIYHSPTPWRQERYRKNVARRLVSRFGADVFPSAKASSHSTPIR